MRQLKRACLLALAGVFLVEAWLWDQLCVLGRQLVGYLPFEAVKAFIAGLIFRLPPPAVVPFFILPVLVILPFKLGGLWLIAHGRFLLGGLVFLAAKMSGLAVTAFLYDLTKDKLMQMAWFRYVAAKAFAIKHWAQDLIAPYRAKVRVAIRQLRTTFAVYLPQVRSGFVGLAMQLRRRMQRAKI